MKNPIAFFCFLITSLICTTSFAQSADKEMELNNRYISARNITVGSAEDTYTGSPYQTEEFQLGNVYKNETLLATNVALRYNVLRDEVEVKKSINTSNSEAKVLIQSPDIYIKILNDLLVFVPAANTSERGGYYIVLEEGKTVDLYKKLSKEYIEGQKAINSITKDILPMYKEDEAFFIVTKDGAFQELPGSRNGKLNLFPEHKKELKQYIKEENLNINRDYDLLKVIKYYNTL